MARQSVANFQAFLKEIYPTYKQELIACNNHALLQWMPKKDKFVGDTYVVPIHYGNPGGRSADYSTARTNVNTTKHKKFVATSRKTDYNFVHIEAEILKAAARGEGSFVEAKALEIKGMLEELGKSLAVSLTRSGSGSIGQISAIGNDTGTNDRLTLTNSADVLYFTEGQVIVFNDTDDATSVRAGQHVVTKVDVDNAYVIVDGNVVSESSAAVNDYIFTEGDPGAKIVGVAGWIPLTAPTAGDSHFGVDRSTNVAALAGHRVDNLGRTILENGQELAMKIGRYGGKPDIWVMNPEAGLQLAAQLGTKVERLDGQNGRTRFGFAGFELVNFLVPGIKVMFDYTCPANRAYMLQKDTWHIAHMGGLPHIADDDGQMAHQNMTTFDGIEVYGRYWAELMCRAPGFNGVMSVSTT